MGDESVEIKINYTGNHLKNLRVSVDSSLKNLRTSYIDILYVHCKSLITDNIPLSQVFIGWGYDSTVEEVMTGLHHLVASGKVLYLVREIIIS